MLFEDIKEQAIAVWGQCDGATLRHRVSKAIEVLSNLGDGQWDGLTGEMTIAVDRVSGTITLPRDVLKPISINIDGIPTFPRDKWFRYHLNGPGEYHGSTSKAWDERGEHPVFREPSEVTAIKLTVESAADDGKEVVVIYQDEDDRQRTATLTLNFATPVESTFTVRRIVAIKKDVTVGDVSLYYLLPEETLAGLYYPDETEPLYRRIRVNAISTVQMIYRRRTTEIRGDQDLIPLRSEMAILEALWAVKKMYQGDVAGQAQHLAAAQTYLEQDQYVRQLTGSPVGPQVLDYSEHSNERLRYGYNF